MTTKQRTSSPAEARQGLTYTQKISLAAGSLTALALAPAAATAAVVHVSGSVSVAMSDNRGTTASWDVDNNGAPDFEMVRSYAVTDPYVLESIRLASDAPLNGNGMVGPKASVVDIQGLTRSFNVGPTLAAPYGWGLAGQPRHQLIYSYDRKNYLGTAAYFNKNFILNAGDNYFGFRFLSGSDMLYGWAKLNLNLTNGSVTISEWAYESTPGTPIHVVADTVPEPSTPALTLLGLGAAGVRAWRSRKQAKTTAVAA